MDNHTQNEKTMSAKRLSQKKKKIIISLIVLMFVIVGGIFSAYQVVKNYMKSLVEQAEYVEESNILIDSNALETLEVETDSELDALLREHLNIVSAEEMASSHDVINILLVGADRRQTNWYGNSDCIILLSVKEGQQQLYMTSIMRDTYVTIPNVGNRKINNAYAVGGPQLLLETVEMNFNIDINYYVSVDFDSFMSIVDCVDGIELDLLAEEIAVMNTEYIAEINTMKGLPYDLDYLPEGQPYSGKVNGKQALAYCRVRYVGNSDYQRTERQRIVLQKIIEKAKDLGLSQVLDIAEVVFPTMVHNIPDEDFYLLLSKVLYYMDYDIISDRIPYDGLYTDVNSNLALVWDQTVEMLHQRIYGEPEVEIPLSGENLEE